MRTYAALALAAIPFSLASGLAHAAGGWTGGQDLYHVPISWCAVEGSPAADNPNILPIGATTPDTSTDAVLWRRHERPTDNIYLNPSGISFRSAINNSWGTLNFPIIADPDTSFGNPGDIRGEDLSVDDTEFNDVINACDDAWADLDPGRAGIGITAVNVNLFVDANGDYFDGGSVATPIGWGGCVESVATGECVAPYDGRIAVADNNYLFPTVADRTWPPSPNDPAGNFQYSVTDPLDQLVGHELGHALGLAHRDTDTDNLMFRQQQDNDGDGQADNIDLNNAEVTQLRDAAQIVPGLETDPPNQFIPGNFVRTRIPDAIGDARDIDERARYLDLAAATVSLDRERGTLYLDAQLATVTQGEQVQERPFQVFYLLDTDGDQEGAPAEFLREIGLPEVEGLDGADVVIRADVGRGQVRGTAWRVQRGDPVAFERVAFDLLRLVMHPYYPAGFERPGVRDAAVFDVARVELPRQVAGVALDRDFAMQVIVALAGERVVDRLAEEGFGQRFVLELPSFPHCYVQEDAAPGGTVPVRIEGLRPNRGMHGLIGPREVFKGTTNAEGGGEIQFPVPADTRPGFHLVTIGNDGTALTADCTVRVVGDRGENGKPPIDPHIYSLLKSHERLLHDQQELLRLLAKLMQEVIGGGEVTDADRLAMVREYNRLLNRQTRMIERFESIIREHMRR